MVLDFLRSFTLSALGLLLVFSGLGYAASALLFRAPAQTFHLRGANFTIPDGWSCEKEDTEVICGKPTSKRDALIITTTKTIGVIDTLERYREHLGTPQPITYNDGSAGMSEVRYVRTELYGGRAWVDGMHHGSEVPNYDTRYLATVAGPTAILITFSCKADVCESYKSLVDAFVGSLDPRDTSAL
ncbi:hypothetical protein [Mesorhizobium sp. KR9-304]|uniref:hypothetical protein n=1 Tax=Mesorhizobium sp. KR9-304 TaxID=3156614 RepID=UPI0032B316B5